MSSMIEDWYSLESHPVEKKLEEASEKIDLLEKDRNETSVKLNTLQSQYNDLKTLADSLASRLEDSERKSQELTTMLSKLVEELRSQQCTQSLLLEEVRLLRSHEGVKHTNDLLEEIKVLKQRELNLLLREKIPVPFFSSTETLLTRKTRL